jgi:hypothetical protein
VLNAEKHVIKVGDGSDKLAEITGSKKQARETERL